MRGRYQLNHTTLTSSEEFFDFVSLSQQNFECTGFTLNMDGPDPIEGPTPKRRRMFPTEVAESLPLLVAASAPSLTSASTAPSTNLSPTTPEEESQITLGKPVLDMEEYDSREPSDLANAGYEPVWSSALGYPGEIPPNIAELLYPGTEKYVSIIGPISGIFWLLGIEFFNELVDDPGYVLTDEVRYLPHGSPRLWIIQILYDEGKIPDRFMDFVQDSPGMRQMDPTGDQQMHQDLARNSSIPQQITTTVQQHRITDLFPFGRNGSMQAQISGVKMKWVKNPDKLSTAIEQKLLTTLGENLLFRGISRPALLSLMAVFWPVISSAHTDNEFGPGFYTTPNISMAAMYAGPNGAMLVFENPMDGREKLILAGEDWQTVVRFWTGNVVGNYESRVPANWQGVDFLEGAISKPREGRNAPRVEGDCVQIVGVSTKAFESLQSSLRMIIWMA